MLDSISAHFDIRSDEHYHAPAKHGLVYCGIISFFLVLATIAVCLRLYVRARISRNLAMDDAILAMSQAISLTGASMIAVIDVGVDKYDPTSDEAWSRYGTMFFTAAATWATTSILLKVAVAMWFLRTVHQQTHRRAIVGSIAVYAAFFTIFIFVLMFRCGVPNPPSRVFRLQNCTFDWSALGPAYYTAATINAICDWLFALSAVSLIVTAKKMTRRAQASAAFVVLLAVVGSVISIVRLPFMSGWQFGPHYLVQQRLATMLAVVEVEIGTIAISLATMMPFLKMWSRKLEKMFPGIRLRSSNGDVEKHGQPVFRAPPMPGHLDMETPGPGIAPRVGILPSTYQMEKTAVSELVGLGIKADGTLKVVPIAHLATR